MSNEIDNQNAEEVISDEEQIQESEELVENEEEVLEDANIEEAKAKKEMAHGKKDDDEEDEEKDEGYHKDDDHDPSDDDSKDDDDEEEVEEIQIPKTKAATINAAVEMLKKARKHEAQAMFKKMVGIKEGAEESDEVVTEESTPAKEVEFDVDYKEDLDALVSEEATLSDGFRDKAGIIFETALKAKVGDAVEKIEAEMAQNLEEEVTEIQATIVEKVDSYLNYVVETWMKDNEVAVENGLRTEIAEEFMTSLQSVFKEHYIEVPEGKLDLVDELSAEVKELEENLNKSTEDNISLTSANQAYAKADVIRKQSSGLAATEAEKLNSLVEDIEFEDEDTFEMKVKTVKESYFTSGKSESVDEADALVGNEEAPVANSGTMDAYTQAITKHLK